MDKSNKIIIWGHKHYTDTASYFLVCIYRTFEKLGYDVYWFDDREYPNTREFDYNNSIFFIDNQSGTDINCPVISSGIYISWDRFRNVDKYLGNVKRLINMRVPEFKRPNPDGVRFIEADKGVIYDKTPEVPYEVMYFSLATNIWPEEMEIEDIDITRNNEYNFIGTIHAPRPNAEPLHQQFIEIVKQNNITFNHYDAEKAHVPSGDRAIDEDTNIKLMQKSFFVPDFRPQEQKDTLYVSCRVMKAISYGCPVVCDAPYVKDFIDKEVLCAETAQEIFDLGIEHQYDKERMQHLFEVVKRDHTYLNRCNGIIEIIRGL